MSSENTSLRVPLFDGKNFGLWKKQMTVSLKVKGLSSSLEKADDTKKDETWQKHDNEAQAILFSSLDQSVALKVLSCDTAADIWSRLKEVYENTNVALVGKVFEEYYSYRKSPGDDMATHVSKVEALASHLATVGQQQTDVSVMSRLLHSLPSSYNSLKEAWESVDSAKQTKTALISRLLSHGVVNEESSKDLALIAEQGKKKGKCYNCGKYGHWARDCRSKPKDNNGENNKGYDRSKNPRTSKDHAAGRDNDEGPGVAMVMQSSSQKSENWIVDSGASKHCCCQKEWFASMIPWSEKLQVGNNEWIESEGKGSIVLSSKVNSRMEKVTLNDVLFMPRMSHNLFSTGRASANNVETRFDRMGCEVSVNGKVYMRGSKRSNGLCYLDVQVTSGSALMATEERTLDEWHRSLGHASTQVINEMANNDCVRGMQIVDSHKGCNCSSCAEGKATRASHTTPSSYVANEVGDRVDMDLIGPVNDETLGKKRYILLAKDRFSDYSHIYLLNNKAEVAEKLQNYISVFEVESGRRIKEIRTDNGSEFSNAQVKTLCDLEHVRLSFSAPYVPEQNGVAERNNRTIIEDTRTLLSDSRLPKSLWGEAANTAVYLRNRIPKKGSKMTPYEIYCGHKPYVGHLVPFGTEVHSLISDRRIGKFDPKTEESYIVGFTERTNTYRILIKAAMKVKITCDVIFRPHDQRLVQVPGRQPKESVTIGVTTTDGQFKSVLTQYFEELQNNLGCNTLGETGSRDNFVTAAAGPDDQTTPEITSPSFSEIVSGDAPPRLTPRTSSLMRSVGMCDLRPISSTPLSQMQLSNRSDERPPDLGNQSISFHPFQGRQLPRTPPHSVRLEPRPSISRQSTNDGAYRSDAGQYGEIHIAHQGSTIDEPKTYAEAMSGPNRAQWKAAIDTELQAHKVNETWKTTAKPKNGTVLTAKWVFKIKRDESGNVAKFKARLVARGFQQQEGRDFTETYAPVARSESVRILLAIATIKQLFVERFDVSTAFLHGTLKEDVYIDAPDGVVIRSGQCLKLIKALYGLKQAPLAWHSTFDSAALAIGFVKIASDICVYIHKSKQAYMSIYVDDGLIIGKTREICLEVIRQLNRFFTTNRISGEIFLGMQLKGVNNGLHLSQKRYVIDLLRRFNMEGCLGSDTPLVDSKILFEQEGDKRADVPYRAAIGGLLYAALCTRPDILFPTILLSRFNEEPLTKHWAAIKRILSYLKRTVDYGLYFKNSDAKVLTIDAYSDADWAGDMVSRRSTSGVIIFLNGCPIIFLSRQQTTVAQSSTEAELIAACEATKELLWLMSLLSDLGIAHEKPTLYVDNKSTIAMIRNNDTKRRSKHIDVKFHLVREKHLDGSFNLEHVGSNQQLADYLTKPIGRNQLQELLTRSKIISTHDAGFEGECRDSATPASCGSSHAGQPSKG